MLTFFKRRRGGDPKVDIYLNLFFDKSTKNKKVDFKKFIFQGEMGGGRV